MPASPALTRLSSGHYNTGDWNATTNQGGMGGDGHRQALVPPKPPQTGSYPVLTSDIAAVAAEMAQALTDATAAAASAMEVAVDIADLNSQLYIQATDPGAVGSGKLWADSTGGVLKIRNAANTAWVLVELPALASAATAGLMSAADKSKLDGVAVGATALSLASTAPVALSASASVGTGTTAARSDHIHPLPPVATTGTAGVMSAADKAKLDGLNGAIKIANGSSIAVGEYFLMSSPAAMPSGWTYDGSSKSITIPMNGGTWVGRCNLTARASSIHGGHVGHVSNTSGPVSLLWYGAQSSSDPFIVNINVGDYLPIIFQRLA